MVVDCLIAVYVHALQFKYTAIVTVGSERKRKRNTPEENTHLTMYLCFHLARTGIVISFALCLLLLGVLVTVGFGAMFRFIIDQRVALRVGGQSFGFWSKPPVEPIIRIYVYNVTNADEFLNNGTKPQLDELGPYVYV